MGPYVFHHVLFETPLTSFLSISLSLLSLSLSHTHTHIHTNYTTLCLSLSLSDKNSLGSCPHLLLLSLSTIFILRKIWNYNSTRSEGEQKCPSVRPSVRMSAHHWSEQIKTVTRLGSGWKWDQGDPTHTLHQTLQSLSGANLEVRGGFCSSPFPLLPPSQPHLPPLTNYTFGHCKYYIKNIARKISQILTYV